MVQLTRLTRHLLTTGWSLRRAFPPASLERIEAAIREGESRHTGQVCFAVESSLDPADLMRGVSARQRAIEVFSILRVWDTEHDNGVLIYLLLADRDVEIVADRGINRKMGEGWEPICQQMEAAFRRKAFEAGVLTGIQLVGHELARHFPGPRPGGNELPDRPVLL